MSDSAMAVSTDLAYYIVVAEKDVDDPLICLFRNWLLAEAQTGPLAANRSESSDFSSRNEQGVPNGDSLSNSSAEYAVPDLSAGPPPLDRRTGRDMHDA